MLDIRNAPINIGDKVIWLRADGSRHNAEVYNVTHSRVKIIVDPGKSWSRITSVEGNNIIVL